MKILIYLLSLASLFSCVEGEFDLPETSIEPKLGVMAFLMDSTLAEVRISKSLTPASLELAYRVPDAEVKLFKNDSLLTNLQNYPAYDAKSWRFGGYRSSVYLSDEIIIVEEGANYHLVIDAPSYPTVRSEAVVAITTLRDVKLEATFSFTEPDFSGKSRKIIDKMSIKYTNVGDMTGEIYVTTTYQNNSPDVFGLPIKYDRDTSVYHHDFVYGEEYLRLDPLSMGWQTFIDPTSRKNPNPFGLLGSPTSLSIIRVPEAYTNFSNIVVAQDLQSLSGLYATSPTTVPTNMIGGYGIFTIIERHHGLFDLR
ncbi:DUF4249 family protein [Neolewinella antarctica]|uniref:DUF4249 family protein n=1 Tax=Neolewinella antarctica TaxID=442734 RepID=A0ABX0XC20_9BACT|nr:DUF4249 family protein [Neolewinella antarctica]NJC26474.1 hypothetical protein [Neolewinella antarctica]